MRVSLPVIFFQSSLTQLVMHNPTTALSVLVGKCMPNTDNSPPRKLCPPNSLITAAPLELWGYFITGTRGESNTRQLGIFVRQQCHLVGICEKCHR